MVAACDRRAGREGRRTRAGSRSTRSSCPSAATRRCSAWLRWPCPTRTRRTACAPRCSTRSSDDPPDPAPLARVLADPDGGGRGARRPPGRGDPAPDLGHRGHQRVRHPGGGGLPRASATRRATSRWCGRCCGVRLKGSRGLHEVGPPPAHRAAARVRGATTRGCCLRSATRSSAGSTSAAGSSGRARSAARSRTSSDERDARPRLRAAAAARPAERARRARWRASWSSGASRWPARWTARPATCSPTRRSIELARRAPRDRERPRADPRAAAPDAPPPRRRGCSRRSRAGATREAPPPPPEPPPRDPADAPLVSLAQALVRHRSMEEGVAVELIATQAELAALVSRAAPRRGRRPRPRGPRLAPRAGRRRAARAGGRAAAR